MRFVPFALLLALTVGCQGSRDDAPRAAEDPDHNTLGIWPNVVIDVDSQKTAADLLYEILQEAVGDANTAALPWAQFRDIVDKVQECGRNTANPPPPLPPTHTQHAQRLQAALAAAQQGTAAGWTQCANELDHGH